MAKKNETPDKTEDGEEFILSPPLPDSDARRAARLALAKARKQAVASKLRARAAEIAREVRALSNQERWAEVRAERKARSRNLCALAGALTAGNLEKFSHGDPLPLRVAQLVNEAVRIAGAEVFAAHLAKIVKAARRKEQSAPPEEGRP